MSDDAFPFPPLPAGVVVGHRRLMAPPVSLGDGGLVWTETRDGQVCQQVWFPSTPEERALAERFVAAAASVNEVPTSESPLPELPQEVRDLLDRGERVLAIKAYVEAKQCLIKTAMLTIDEHLRRGAGGP